MAGGRFSVEFATETFCVDFAARSLVALPKPSPDRPPDRSPFDFPESCADIGAIARQTHGQARFETPKEVLMKTRYSLLTALVFLAPFATAPVAAQEPSGLLDMDTYMEMESVGNPRISPDGRTCSVIAAE